MVNGLRICRATRRIGGRRPDTVDVELVELTNNLIQTKQFSVRKKLDKYPDLYLFRDCTPRWPFL